MEILDSLVFSSYVLYNSPLAVSLSLIDVADIALPFKFAVNVPIRGTPSLVPALKPTLLGIFSSGISYKQKLPLCIPINAFVAPDVWKTL